MQFVFTHSQNDLPPLSIVPFVEKKKQTVRGLTPSPLCVFFNCVSLFIFSFSFCSFSLCHFSIFTLRFIALLSFLLIFTPLFPVLSFSSSLPSSLSSGCVKFSWGSERLAFKPGGRRTRFLSTPCLALCV